MLPLEWISSYRQCEKGTGCPKRQEKAEAIPKEFYHTDAMIT
jgi:hypothetical protein